MVTLAVTVENLPKLTGPGGSGHHTVGKHIGPAPEAEAVGLRHVAASPGEGRAHRCDGGEVMSCHQLSMMVSLAKSNHPQLKPRPPPSCVPVLGNVQVTEPPVHRRR